jgi:hypothetical protein
MKRKQSMQHFDQRQLLLLENAYYQVPLFVTRNSINAKLYCSATPQSVLRGKKNIANLWNFSFVT